MAVWTNILDAVLNIGKPIRSIDGFALRDNPIAIAEGASGAPRIHNDALLETVIGSIPIHSNNVESSTAGGSNTKLKETIIGRNGNLRISFDLKADGDISYARIYKNDGAIGTLRATSSLTYVTFTEDFTGFVIGDKIQVYGYNTAATCYVRNLRLLSDRAINYASLL